MSRRWKPAHVDPNLGDDLLSAVLGDSRDLVDQVDCGLERTHPLLDLHVDGFDLLLHQLDLAAEQESLVGTHRAIASSAMAAESVLPAASSFSIARPDKPITLDATSPSLILAPSSTFWTRVMSRVFS